MSKVKIIGTIGPASFSEDILKQMVRNGLSAVRINTAHVEPDYIEKVRKLVDGINADTGSHVGIMIDLKGPELRLTDLKGGSFQVIRNKRYLLSDGDGKGDLKINRAGIIEKLKPGHMVKMNDGLVTFEVAEEGKDSVLLEAVNDGVLRSRARINVPGVYLDLGTATDRDRDFIRAGVEQEIDFFAMSFVQTRDNVLDLEQIIRESGGINGVTSKIETMKGYSDIKDIVAVSEMIMVARGDLGVELPLKEIGIAQKKIIVESHRRGRPAILATQILESMVTSPEPTRAEVTDVTNAVFDNADVLMLSEEAAIGKYPAEAVRYLRDISEYALNSIGDLPEPEEFYGNEVAYSMAKAAKISSRMIDTDGIIAFTRSGNTARMLSALRPTPQIYAVVTSKPLARKINLLHGVVPVLIDRKHESSRDLNTIMEVLRSQDSFRVGKNFAVLSGLPYFLFGGTNDLRIVSMGGYAGRGYPRGKTVSGYVTHDPAGKADILIVNGDRFMEDYRKFKGIIFTGFPTHRDIMTAMESGMSVMSGAQFSRKLKENEKIMWDGDSGIIIEIPD